MPEINLGEWWLVNDGKDRELDRHFLIVASLVRDFHLPVFETPEAAESFAVMWALARDFVGCLEAGLRPVDKG